MRKSEIIRVDAVRHKKILVRIKGKTVCDTYPGLCRRAQPDRPQRQALSGKRREDRGILQKRGKSLPVKKKSPGGDGIPSGGFRKAYC